MSGKIKLKTIRLVDVKAIEEIEITPGRITVISGGNEQGKSSLLDGIAKVLEGGNDPEMIRHGAKRAETTLLIDEDSGTGPRSYEVKRIQTPGGSRLEILLNGKPVTKPKAVLESLIHVSKVNPGRFLDGSDSDRLELLLESADIKLPEDVEERTGQSLEGLEKLGPLEQLDQIEQAIMARRRELGRSVKRQQAALAELESGQNYSTEGVAELEASLEQDRGRLEKVRDLADEERERLRSEARKETDAIQEELRVLQERLASRENRLERDLAEVSEKTGEATGDLRERISAAEAELKTARAALESQGRTTQIRADLEQTEAEHTEAEKQLEAARKIRTDSLEAVPIDGLSVDAGKLHYQGVPWDHLNTARKVSIVFRLITESAPPDKLLVICSDALNDLDPETTRRFFEAAAELENTYFMLERVTAGPLAATAEIMAGGEG